MRFIIHEQPFERIVAAGQYRYEQDGSPTGALEHWRLTAVSAPYHFLRVDLDGRAASGNSYLYHLTLGENGRPERLQYRFWGDGLTISGNVLLDQEMVTATRVVNGRSHEELITLPADYGFAFPSVTGLGWLARQMGERERGTAVFLDPAVDQPESAFKLLVTDLTLERGAALTLRWPGQARTLWLDEQGWPVRMERGGDGLTAVVVHHIRYERGEI
jgi:hypothetical protein